MHFLCNICGLGVKVIGDMTEGQTLLIKHPLWRESRPCIRPDCSGEMEYQGKFDFENQVQQAHTLGTHEFFRALCGFGTPDEIASEPEVVRALLRSEKIVDVKVRKSYARTIIDHIDLENGLRLHLTLGSEGAVVYKITRYTHGQLEDDQSGVHPDPQGDGIQRDARGDGGDGEGQGSQRGGLGGVRAEDALDGGDHQGGSQDAPAVSGRCSDDGA